MARPGEDLQWLVRVIERATHDSNVLVESPATGRATPTSRGRAVKCGGPEDRSTRSAGVAPRPCTATTEATGRWPDRAKISSGSCG